LTSESVAIDGTVAAAGFMSAVAEGLAAGEVEASILKAV
jgi:hypothetical protein